MFIRVNSILASVYDQDDSFGFVTRNGRTSWCLSGVIISACIHHHTLLDAVFIRGTNKGTSGVCLKDLNRASGNIARVLIWVERVQVG
jgi:hypothetical protein